MSSCSKFSNCLKILGKRFPLRYRPLYPSTWALSTPTEVGKIAYVGETFSTLYRPPQVDWAKDANFRDLNKRCLPPLSAPPLPDTQPPIALPALSFAPLPPPSPPPVHPPLSRARLFIAHISQPQSRVSRVVLTDEANCSATLCWRSGDHPMGDSRGSGCLGVLRATSDTPSRHTVVECRRFSSGVCAWRLIG